LDEEIRSHISDELNVVTLDELSSAGADLVDITIKANFRTIGTRYGADVQAIAAALMKSDAGSLVKSLRAQGNATITFEKDGMESSADITIDDLVITETPKSGWSVSSHAGESVALDLELTPSLIQAGLAREVIRAIQEERKNSGFDISDRITVEWSAPENVASAISSSIDVISNEVLATSITENSELTQSANEIGLMIRLAKVE